MLRVQAQSFNYIVTFYFQLIINFKNYIKMKQLIVFVLLLVALTSCEDGTSHPNGFYTITSIEHEGHSYLIYCNSVGSVQGMTHDMNCACFKEHRDK